MRESCTPPTCMSPQRILILTRLIFISSFSPCTLPPRIPPLSPSFLLTGLSFRALLFFTLRSVSRRGFGKRGSVQPASRPGTTERNYDFFAWSVGVLAWLIVHVCLALTPNPRFLSPRKDLILISRGEPNFSRCFFRCALQCSCPGK